MRILVVEDEVLVAMVMEEMLTELGYDVQVAMRLEPGMQLAKTLDVDLAILDVNLAGRVSFPIADILQDRGIPFFFATAYGAAGLTPAYKDRVIVRKPFLENDLAAAIGAVIN